MFAAVRTSGRRVEEDRARREEANLTVCSARALAAISMGVMQADNDFEQRGSPFPIRQRPDGPRSIASYEIHRSGNLRTEATLAFVLHSDGVVRAETDARGADLPAGVSVGAITAAWAEQAADQTMFLRFLAINNTLNAALRRLGYSKKQMTAHGFKGMAHAAEYWHHFSQPTVIAAEWPTAHAKTN